MRRARLSPLRHALLGVPLALLGLAVVVTAQPTSAWFSDTAVVAFEASVAEPEPPPPDPVTIPWEGHGDEHASIDCEGRASWHFVLTGQTGEMDADLTATFAAAGPVGPVAMAASGNNARGARHAVVETPTGDTLLSAVVAVSAEPATPTQLALSASECLDEAVDEGPDETEADDLTDTHEDPAPEG